VAVVVGFIALAGLGAETGVVMMAYLDESFSRRKAQGLMKTKADLDAAIVGGSAERVRPVLMTVSTTIIALFPVMFGTGTGSEVMKRIASPMVGGLVSSIILTLLILPAVYGVWKRAELRNQLADEPVTDDPTTGE